MQYQKKRVRDEIIDKFKNVPAHLQVIVIGTTQAHFAFSFQENEYKGFNMSCYLNTMPFSRLLLEKYKTHIDKKAIILITLEYPIFCIDDFARLAMINVQQYSKILPYKNPYCSLKRQVVYRMLPLCKNPRLDLLENTKKLEKRNALRNHFKPWELDKQCKTLRKFGWEDAIDIPEYITQGHLMKNERCESAMQNVRNEVLKIIELCKQNAWIPVMVGLPYSKILNSYVPDTFKEKCFYSNIDAIKDATGCRFWDYSEDEEMQNIHNYMDIWFLNKNGREKFTNKIYERVKEVYE
jgi:hypothetical protein